MAKTSFALRAPLPAWVLVAVRVLCAGVIGLLWDAPTWLLVMSTAAAAVATGVFVPLLALAFGGLVGWLPPLIAGTVNWPWTARIAAIIVCAALMLLCARLTERVPFNARVEWQAVTQLALRLLPGVIAAELLWLVSVLLVASGMHFGAVMALCAIGGLLALGALALVLFRGAARNEL